MRRDSILAASAPALRVIAAAAAGAALWYAMRLCQGALRPVVERAPEWAALAANAGVEEALRLGLAMLLALYVRRAGLEPGAVGLGVLAACSLGALENASYLAAFPTLDAYWRLGYALPIHAGAAALYAIATGDSGGRDGESRPAGKSAGIAAAFAIAWAWHSAFNIVAALFPFPALPIVGTVVNLIALSALVAALIIRYGYWSVYAAR